MIPAVVASASTTPGVGITGFLVVSVVLTLFAVSFLVAQRASGRVAPEVDEALRQAQMLETVENELRAMRDATADDVAAPEAVREFDHVLEALEEATLDLRRAAERVV